MREDHVARMRMIPHFLPSDVWSRVNVSAPFSCMRLRRDLSCGVESLRGGAYSRIGRCCDVHLCKEEQRVGREETDKLLRKMAGLP